MKYRMMPAAVLLLLAGGTIQLDTCNRFSLILTDTEDFSSADLSRDRSHELERVEQ